MLNLTDYGPIREISLARPPVNAFDAGLVAALTEALGTAGREASAIVLSGREGMFSAGLDVPALLMLDRKAMGDFWRAFHGLLETLARSPVPVVAAITGHCPAGGAVLCLYCDYRVMTRGEYRIGLNETRVGLSLPPSIHRALVRLVGERLAERLVVSGALVSPGEALQVGLVDELAESPEAAVSAALDWCETLLTLPARTMARNREIMRASLTSLFDESAEKYHDAFLEIWFSPETQATLQALVASLKKK